MTADQGAIGKDDTQRCVGFEVEYAGVNLAMVADVIVDLYGGHAQLMNPLSGEVTDTEWGSFKLLLDSAPLQKLHHALNEDLPKEIKLPDALSDLPQKVGDTIGEVAVKVVPFEIVLPPVPISKIDRLEHLITRIRETGGMGTKGSLLYAFGLHINAEAVSTETASILRHIQSFLLLEPWLMEEHGVDLSRRISGFVAPFPNDYRRLVVSPDYAPNLKQLVLDYHSHNPTRSRSLDLLPLFAHLNGELVRSLYGAEEKISPRPTYHYRLPNCELGNPAWSLSLEWERWQYVEKLAAAPDMLTSLMKDWKRDHARMLEPAAIWHAEGIGFRWR
ncbi:amidoligase family protein [Pseudovibrio sp. SPO723]|uniref:amidoligase family protein n=1 Tax=Nesiotobacter zosterae TaxID=392721 RepID=UPI0029C11049|nr:amidoligase family protein [Pseudovibrio sp. SPO723]MDX5593734.1 amidoligase family protein [Pseudovibrio sp. SPO723]